MEILNIICSNFELREVQFFDKNIPKRRLFQTWDVFNKWQNLGRQQCIAAEKSASSDFITKVQHSLI